MKPFESNLNQAMHLKRACELALGSEDGKWIFASLFAALENKLAAKAA